MFLTHPTYGQTNDLQSQDHGLHDYMQQIASPAGMWISSIAAIEKSAQCVLHAETACQLPAIITELALLKTLPPALQIKSVNDWANDHPYVSDMTNWHVEDYWATLPEFVLHGGDCEDYAIAKYSLLRAAGFRAEDLQVVLVHDKRSQTVHAVLDVRLQGKTLILDNQSATILEGLQVPRYQALVAVNETGLWQLPGLVNLLAVLHLETSTVPASGQTGSPRHEH